MRRPSEGVDKRMTGVTHDDHDATVAQRLVAFLEAGDKKPKSGPRARDRDTYFRRVELVLIAQVGQPRVMGYTRNLSPGGVGVLTRRGFKVGERFVTLLSFGAGLGKYVLCRVTFCRYVSDSMYEMGAAFEATAPHLNENHRIPEEWVAVARHRDAPTETGGASAKEKSRKG
jgi:PilZ domain